jgi:hydroxypyruvate reductase
MLTPAITAVIKAALAAVDPFAAVCACLRGEETGFWAGDGFYAYGDYDRILVIGAGKATAPMAQAVESVLGDHLTDGCVVVKYGHEAPTRRVRVLQAGHPVPDAAGLAAGAAILDLARQAGERDLVICLLSGGGSALLEALPPGIGVADLQQTTDLLLASGATIHEINTLRKHLSLLKGGRLAAAVAPATLLTLVLSDVVGSPLDVIASGPTVADTSTWADAWAVVDRYDLADRLPAAVRRHLEAGLAGAVPETPKPGDPLFARSRVCIVGDNAVAAAAAAAAAAHQGYHSLILTTFLEGEAREVARVAVALAREVQTYGRPVPPPACLILGGETTVTLGPQSGRGGRNQELALAAAVALAGVEGITLVALATDGTDGPTDAAGGVVDGQTLTRGAALGLDARAHLRRHDAYPYLEAVGALLKTGPTRTNVNDLLFLFVHSRSEALP